MMAQCCQVPLPKLGQMAGYLMAHQGATSLSSWQKHRNLLESRYEVSVDKLEIFRTFFSQRISISDPEGSKGVLGLFSGTFEGRKMLKTDGSSVRARIEEIWDFLGRISKHFSGYNVSDAEAEAIRYIYVKDAAMRYTEI